MNANSNELLITTFKCDIDNEKNANLFTDHMKSVRNDMKDFVDSYFNGFFLITKIGKCIYRDTHTNVGSEGINVIQLEYLSVLFAKAYFEYKSEKDYLNNINKRLEMLVKMHGQYEQNGIAEKYELYKNQMEYLQYANFHFSVVVKAFEKKISLAEVINLISNGTCCKINTGIVHRKGLCGNDLVNECVQTIMELNVTIPEIKIQYVNVFEAMFDKRIIEIA